MDIDYLKNLLTEISEKPIADLPTFRAMFILADCFIEMGIPVKHIGKIKMDVAESFFKDEKKAKEVIKLWAQVVLKMKKGFELEFGSDAEQILADSMAQMSLSFHQ